jgi:hypothetical protein
MKIASTPPAEFSQTQYYSELKTQKAKDIFGAGVHFSE